jgi:hypothetical protein
MSDLCLPYVRGGAIVPLGSGEFSEALILHLVAQRLRPAIAIPDNMLNIFGLAK